MRRWRGEEEKAMEGAAAGMFSGLCHTREPSQFTSDTLNDRELHVVAHLVIESGGNVINSLNTRGTFNYRVRKLFTSTLAPAKRQ